MPKISVIVPVYNSEKYLPRCLDSIVNQTLEDIEIICVDDGSTDNSSKILQQYAARDKRIKFISQENQGLSITRNNGMALARGQYLSFTDSDDWIEENMFSELAVHLAQSKPDYTCFRIQYDNELSETRFVYGKPYLILEMKGVDLILEDTLKVRNIPTSAWSKVYSRDFLLRFALRFEPGIVNEDTLFSIQVACRAQKVTFLNGLFYHTIEREGSISRSSQERLFLDMHTALLKAKEYMQEIGCFERFRHLYEARYLKSMLYNLLQAAQRLSYAEFRKIRNICMDRTFYKKFNCFGIRKCLPLRHQVMLMVSKSALLFFSFVKFLNKIGWKMH